MIVDAQLRKLRRLVRHGTAKELAAVKAGMHPKTGSQVSTARQVRFVPCRKRGSGSSGKQIVVTDGERIVTIPRHNPINSFTMGTIIRGAGLTIDEFRKLL